MIPLIVFIVWGVLCLNAVLRKTLYVAEEVARKALNTHRVLEIFVSCPALYSDTEGPYLVCGC